MIRRYPLFALCVVLASSASGANNCPPQGCIATPQAASEINSDPVLTKPVLNPALVKQIVAMPPTDCSGSSCGGGGSSGGGTSGGSSGGGSTGGGTASGGTAGQGGAGSGGQNPGSSAQNNPPAQKPGALIDAPAVGHTVVGEGLDGGALGASRKFADLGAPSAAARSAFAAPPQASAPANPLDKVVGDIAALPDSRTPAQKKADALVQQAKAQFIVGGEPQDALQSLTRAVSLDPSNVLAYVRRAEVFNKLKRHLEALADANQALRLDAKAPGAWDQAAWALFRSGKYQEAIDACNHALAMDPSDAFALAIRARARWALGDKAGALEDAQAAARLDGRFMVLAQAMAAGSYRDDGTVLEEEAAGNAAPSGRPLPWKALGGAAALLLALGGGLAAWRLRKPGAPGKKRPTFSALARTTVAAASNGRLAGKYELTRLIGQGGMGTVHEAVDHSLKRAVAVKKMAEGLSDANPKAREMLVREAQTVAALHHPDVVDIYEIVDDGKDLYLVFELVRGKTLSQVIAESGPMPLARCAEILKPVCDALQFAHRQELVHRDLKPGNVMISDDGRVKLMDFGIARGTGVAAAEPGATRMTPESPLLARTRTVMGTPIYMAPEMAFGVVSKEGDVYALGVCLYEMLTGRIPFQNDADKQALNCPAPSTLVPGLNERVDQLLQFALQPDPARRLRTPLAFWAALQAAVQPGTAAAA